MKSSCYGSTKSRLTAVGIRCVDQAKPSIRVVVDHRLADNIYETCTRHGNYIFLVADENTAELLNKNVLNKIAHLIIPASLSIPGLDTGIYDRSQCHATRMTTDKPDSVDSLETVNLVRNKAKDSDLIVAFGSGTVNIC
jgi:glycerol-1-phosphate dehydrogenase [NAD(P)+]